MSFKKSIIVFTSLLVLFVCTAANALEVTPYFKIAQEYSANPQKTMRKWINKDICIEAVISSIGVNAKGGAFIMFHEKATNLPIEFVAYGFHFRSIPEKVKALREGQKVKLRGKITEIKMLDDPRVEQLMITAEPSFLLRAYSPPPEKENIASTIDIPMLYEMNPKAAESKYLGQEITIEGIIAEISIIDDDGNEARYGNALVSIIEERNILSHPKIGYFFIFNGTPRKIADLEKGNKIKIRGIVEDIELNETGHLIILSSSKIMN